jgi:hypothetical protein
LCRSINDITTNAQIRANLTALYGSIDNIDALVGALAEDPKFGSVGPLVNAIIVEQFTRTRAGDKWWYARSGVLDAATQATVKATTAVSVACSTASCEDDHAVKGGWQLMCIHAQAFRGSLGMDH